MTDLKKVIKALEHCKDNQHVNDCDECNYGGKTGMFCVRMIDDVLSLLKDQEPQLVLNIGEQISCKSGSCPKCGKMLNTTCNKKFCGDCGHEVKWE